MSGIFYRLAAFLLGGNRLERLTAAMEGGDYD